jgi:hypothetical protein
MAGMRGGDRQPDSMFSCVSPGSVCRRIITSGAIRLLVDGVLREMSRGIRPPVLAGRAPVTVFTKSRDRLLTQEIARSLFARVLERAEPLMSDEHFTVDETLIEAWASQKSLRPKDGSADGDGRDFRGQPRKNDTHASTTDADSRPYRRTNHGESKLAYFGHLFIENRQGLIADAMAT